MELLQIREIVESHIKIDLSNKSRTQKFVYARAIYFKLCREYTLFSYKDIGASIKKNHATVIHSIKLFDNWISLHEQPSINKYHKMDDEIRVKYEVKNYRFKTRGYYRRKYSIILKEHRDLIHKHQNLKNLLNI